MRPMCLFPFVASFTLFASCSQPLDAPSNRCSALADPDCRDAGVDALDDAVTDLPACETPIAVISEVLFDPEGADGGNEFVELAGPPLAPVDGLILEGFDGSSVTTRWTLPLGGRFDAHGMFLVGGEGVAGAAITLHRTLEQGPDALVLRGCEDELVDAVAWGEWSDTATVLQGAVLAAPSESGESVARCTAYDRTSPLVAGIPSPGEPEAPSECALAPDSPAICDPASWQDVRISEVLYDPEGADSPDAEFVELTGTPGLELDGLALRGVNGANGETYLELELTDVIPASGTLVVGGSSFAADQPWTRALQNGPDAVELVACGDQVVDALAYGDLAGDLGEGAPAPGATNGDSLHRCADEGDNASDFRAGPPTPGQAPPHDLCSENPGTGPEEPECQTNSSLRINEIHYDPDGSDRPDDEFIELLGEPMAQIVGARLILTNGATDEPYLDIVLPDIAFDEAGFALIGGQSPLPIPLQNGPDVVEIASCDGTVLDQVRYGGFGEDIAREGTRGPDERQGGAGVSLSACSRNPDVWYPGVPTPGAENVAIDGHPGCDVPDCRPLPPGTVVFNAVHYDPEGPDDGREFITLWSRTDARVEGLRVLAVNGRDGDVYASVGPFAAEFYVDGYWVLGGAEVELADTRLPFTMQNGPDSLVLLDCSDEILDALAYGDFADATPVGEGESAPACLPNETLARHDVGFDTDDNRADFECQSRSEPAR